MEAESHIAFDPFRLELGTSQACFWRGERSLTLRARSLAVLRYLLEHPGRLVTKAELRQHVWAGMVVSDTVLRVCIRDIRVVLDVTASAPQYPSADTNDFTSLSVQGMMGLKDGHIFQRGLGS